MRAADDAETRCGHSVKYRYGTMFDILVIAQFVLYPEISRAQDLRYNVRILRWATQNSGFEIPIFDFPSEILKRDLKRVCPGFQARTIILFAFFHVLIGQIIVWNSNQTATSITPPNKKKKTLKEFGYTLKCLHTNLQLEIRKIESRKGIITFSSMLDQLVVHIHASTQCYGTALERR